MTLPPCLKVSSLKYPIVTFHYKEFKKDVLCHHMACIRVVKARRDGTCHAKVSDPSMIHCNCPE